VSRMRTLLPLLAALLLAGVLTGCGGPKSITVTADFDDVGDLVKGHSVQVADVRVGRITGIKLTDDFKAHVTMSVKESAHVPKASTAYLRTTSLLGEKFIELRPNDTADPARGPYLRDGDRIAKTGEAPEIEFFAEEAISVLGAVTGDDLATLVDTGAKGFGGRGEELKSLIGDLSTISATLASRTGEITSIIDNLDRATTTLAGGKDDVSRLLVNLATTTKILSDNRDRAVTALQQLSRLASVQNDLLERYSSDMDRQIKQIDAIVDVAASQTGELGRVVDWLDRFLVATPKVIPKDMTQVYMWLVPQPQDARTAGAH
jgi:phospholipid/cholesterol/gamma-HCH transport system substrate-binding protein